MNVAILSVVFLAVGFACLKSLKMSKSFAKWILDDTDRIGWTLITLLLGLLFAGGAYVVYDTRQINAQQRAEFNKTIEDNDGQFKALYQSFDMKSWGCEGVKNGDRITVESNGLLPKVGEVMKVKQDWNQQHGRVYKFEK